MSKKSATLVNGNGSWNGGPRLVKWVFESGESPLEGLVVRKGEERYAGAEVVCVRRFEAINGSCDTYLRFISYVPRERAIEMYREQIAAGFYQSN